MDSGSLYKALGVASAATDADIRTAYRRRALATHPDKGGSAEAFRLVVTAFEILTDPARRGAHDQELASAGQPKASATSSARRKRRRQPGATDEPKAKGGRPERQSCGGEEQRGSAAASREASKELHGLVQELLGLAQRALRARLRQLSDELLRALLRCHGVLNGPLVQAAGDSSDGETSSSLCDDGAEVWHPNKSNLAICWEKLDIEEEDREAAGMAARCPKEAGERKIVKGVSRCKYTHTQKLYYEASVGFEGLVAMSSRSVNLDNIIDQHISMVQMRRRIYDALATGTAFPDALCRAVEQTQAERAAVAAPALKLRFRCPRVTSNHRFALDEVVPIWQAYQETLAMAREERSQRRQELWQRRRQRQMEKRESERCGLPAPRPRLSANEKARRQQEKDEKERLRQQRRLQRAARLQELHRSRTEALVLAVQEELEKRMLKAWGVKALPEGIGAASLPGVPSLSACLCAQLRFQDGSLCTGPLRKSLKLAKRDLAELSALQRTKGDAALKDEISKRDADTMTALFMASLTS